MSELPRDADAPFDLGDEQDVKDRDRAIRAGNISAQQTMRTIMGTPLGRKWMFDLLAFCGVGISSFSSDALETAHREGKRTIGLRLMTEIYDACPDRYTEMMKEARNVR